MTEKTIATLTVRGGAVATVKGRRALANWLRKEARHLERCGREYAPRFTARFFLPVPK